MFSMDKLEKFQNADLDGGVCEKQPLLGVPEERRSKAIRCPFRHKQAREAREVDPAELHRGNTTLP